MKFLVDFLPILLFFLAYKLYDIYVATAVAIVASVIQVVWSWFRHRKVENIQWITMGLIVVLGGLSLLLLVVFFFFWFLFLVFWFFTALGAINLYVAYHYDTETWVNFKLFGMMGLTILFIIAQGFYLSRYIKADEKN